MGKTYLKIASWGSDSRNKRNIFKGKNVDANFTCNIILFLWVNGHRITMEYLLVMSTLFDGNSMR